MRQGTPGAWEHAWGDVSLLGTDAKAIGEDPVLLLRVVGSSDVRIVRGARHAVDVLACAVHVGMRPITG